MRICLILFERGSFQRQISLICIGTVAFLVSPYIELMHTCAYSYYTNFMGIFLVRLPPLALSLCIFYSQHKICGNKTEVKRDQPIAVCTRSCMLVREIGATKRNAAAWKNFNTSNLLLLHPNIFYSLSKMRVYYTWFSCKHLIALYVDFEKSVLVCLLWLGLFIYFTFFSRKIVQFHKPYCLEDK